MGFLPRGGNDENMKGEGGFNLPSAMSLRTCQLAFRVGLAQFPDRHLES